MAAEPDDATLLAMLSAADIAVPDAMRPTVLAAMRALRAAAARLADPRDADPVMAHRPQTPGR